METDSQLVFGILKSLNLLHLAHDALITNCVSLLSRDWEVTVSKIYREANFAADGVVNWALGQELGLLILHIPPASACNSLEADRGYHIP